MRASISHYYVKDIYFTLYMDAIHYCDNNNIDYSVIEKTKEYKEKLIIVNQ